MFHRAARGAMAVAACILLAGCTHAPQSPYEQPADRAWAAAIGSPAGGLAMRAAAPTLQFSPVLPPLPAFRLGRTRAEAKLHPLLRAWLAHPVANQRVRVIVGLREVTEVPRLPLEALSGPAAGRAHAKAVIQALLLQVAAARAPFYHGDTAMVASYGARVLHTYLLAQAVHVEMPLAQVSALAARNDVWSIDPDVTDETPPQCAAPDTNDPTPADGRGAIGSDLWRAQVPPGGRLALLDTGVWPGASLLEWPPPQPGGPPTAGLACWSCDDDACTSGGDDVATGARGHGTTSAGLLVGGDALGPRFRGVTAGYVDAYRVYVATEGQPLLSPAAFVTAVEAATPSGALVAAAEAQANTGPTGIVARFADRAYRAGMAVIAADGDMGADHVGSPACAPWVLGAGARTLGSAAPPTAINESWGEVGFGRRKPDVQAPTRAASAATDGPCEVHTLGATSGSTPFAAGAALLVRQWLARRAGIVDPGQVYAALVASGANAPPYPDDQGAGPIALPQRGLVAWGKVSLQPLQRVTITLPPVASASRVVAGLWYPVPEPARHWPFGWWVTQLHGMALVLRGANGGVLAAAAQPGSVFQRLEWPGKPGASTRPRDAAPLALEIQPQGLDWRPAPAYWFAVIEP